MLVVSIPSSKINFCSFLIEYYMYVLFVVLVAGVFDLLDGQVARKGKTESKFGALLDSTVDRYSEIFIWFGHS